MTSLPPAFYIKKSGLANRNASFWLVHYTRPYYILVVYVTHDPEAETDNDKVEKII